MQDDVTQAGRPHLVGISGGSGSGKTSFVRALKAALPEGVTFVSADDYYRPLAEQRRDAQGEVDFDRPDSIDHAAMVANVRELMAGRPFTRQQYMHNESDQRGPQLQFAPNPIIICEGLFVFYVKELHELFDLRVFIDASDVAKVSRRIQRDLQERNQTVEDVIYRYEHHVLPSYEAYVKPFRRDAHLVINNHDHFEEGLAVLGCWIRQRVARAGVEGT